MMPHARPLTVALAALSVPLLSGAAGAAPLHTLFAFDGANGFASQSPLVSDADGNLFGTTPEGGTADRGVVFELSPPATSGAAWSYSIAHSFGGTGDGDDPLGGLVLNGGRLFGTTYMGGAADQGSVFMLTPPKTPGAAWKEQVIFSFGPTNLSGYWPTAGVLLGAHGVLYGTTSYGGTNDAGTVFALVPPTPPGKTWTENVLYNFEDYGSGDGYSPQTGVIADTNGNLYGTTVTGGAIGNSNGAVFELTPAEGGGYTETVLYRFAGQPDDGSLPHGPLLLGAGGVLFGTTAQGGAVDAGTVFELVPGAGGWTEQVLYSFANNNVDGIGPQGPLVLDAHGNLYGATPFGGTKTFGTLFKLTHQPSPPWTETILHDFTGSTDGSTPYGGLAMSVNGTLYGTTSAGGAPADGRWGWGTVYQDVP